MANPPTPVNLRALAASYAKRYGLPESVFLAQIQQESGFNPNARSSAGAEGIAQFIPSTAKAYGLDNPFDPQASLDAAARYDSDLLKKYGTIQRALSAYNSGRPDAYKDPNFAGGQTYRYVKDILSGVVPAAAAASAPSANPSIAPPAAAAPRPSIDLFNVGNQMFGLPQLTTPLPAPVQPIAPTPTAPSATAAPSSAFAGKGSTIKQLESFASPFGLTVTATTNGQHAKNSYHYLGRAVDFGGPLNQQGYKRMAALAESALQHPGDFKEVIYTGPGTTGYSILAGRVVPNSSLSKSLFQEHTNHVHLAR